MASSMLFILFFGTRPGKTTQYALPGVPCPYCFQEGKLWVYKQMRFVHLFWIPVYRLSPSEYVRCQHCKKAYAKKEYTPEMTQEIDKQESE